MCICGPQRTIFPPLILVLALVASSGCTSGFYGYRPDQIQVTLKGDSYEEYVRVREYAIKMTEAYDSRAGANRGAIYAGSTTLLGLTAASSGLGAFGAAATGAGLVLPVVSTFVNGLFSVFDSRHLANIYTTAANKLRKIVADSDAAFLAEPVDRQKWIKITDLQKSVLEVISEVEEGRNAATPDPSKAIKKAMAAKNEAEEALGIKPTITALIPSVLPLSDGLVRVKGSGFDASAEVLLDGSAQSIQFISETELLLSVPAPTNKSLTVVERSIVIRNKYGREAGSPTTLVQADLAVLRCTPGKRTAASNEPAVLFVEGTGFQPDGSVAVTAGATVIGSTWRSHTQWELQIDNGSPSQKVNVTKVTVTNPLGATKSLDMKPADLATCSVSAVAQK
jgi:hypothetical protein